MSLVSVIIPNYNNDLWLKSCFESCLAQGKEYLKEIVLVDDGSTDHSMDVASLFGECHPGLLKVFRNPGKGANSARRFGLSQCTGDYVQWLDGDDVLLEDKFKSQLPAFSIKPQISIVYSGWKMIRQVNEGYTRETIHEEHSYNDIIYSLLADTWRPVHSYLMRRESALRVVKEGGWDEQTRVAQDREFFTIAALTGEQFFFVPGIFAVYNMHNNNSVSSLPFKTRMEYNIKLEDKFAKRIERTRQILDINKKIYTGILDTQALKAVYYHKNIRLLRPVKFKYIQWNLIHWKMRFFIPFIYFYKHVEYFILISRNKEPIY